MFFQLLDLPDRWVWRTSYRLVSSTEVPLFLLFSSTRVRDLRYRSAWNPETAGSMTCGDPCVCHCAPVCNAGSPLAERTPGAWGMRFQASTAIEPARRTVAKRGPSLLASSRSPSLWSSTNVLNEGRGIPRCPSRP